MVQSINRKNNNEKYVWYMEQRVVDQIEQILTGEKEIYCCFGYSERRIFRGDQFEILYDSDGFIRGVQNWTKDQVMI
jgi:hypothetical protein